MGKTVGEIKVQNGLRHGCCMAPVLFNLYPCLTLERWLEWVEGAEGVGTTIKYNVDKKLFWRQTRNVRERKTTECQFADDSSLLASTREDLKLINIWKVERWRLWVSSSICMGSLIARSGRKDPEVEQRVAKGSKLSFRGFEKGCLPWREPQILVPSGKKWIYIRPQMHQDNPWNLQSEAMVWTNHHGWSKEKTGMTWSPGKDGRWRTSQICPFQLPILTQIQICMGQEKGGVM